MPRRVRHDKRRSNRLSIHDWRVLQVGTEVDIEVHFGGSLTAAREAWHRHREHALFRGNPGTAAAAFWLFDAGDPSLALLDEPTNLAEHDAIDARRRDWLTEHGMNDDGGTVLPLRTHLGGRFDD